MSFDGFLQDDLDILIGCLDNTVCLRPTWGWSVVLDPIFLENLLNFVLEMHAIVRYHLVGDPIATYDVLLNKPCDMFLLHSWVRCSLYPLGEVIDSYQNILMTIRHLRCYLPDYVNPPNWKRPRGRHIVEFLCRNIVQICMHLTLVRLSYEIYTIGLQRSPVETHLEDLLSKHLFVHVWTTNSQMYLIDLSFSFSLIYTP